MDHNDYDEDGKSASLTEGGFEIATLGGGTIEEIPGSGEAFAPTECMGAETVPVDPAFNALPCSCDIEYSFGPESVRGKDGRVHVANVTRIPWRYICQLIITMKDGRKSRCTGWFISPRTVMTAGHCVYSHSAGGWAQSIEVIPGMNGAFQPFGSAVGTSFRHAGIDPEPEPLASARPPPEPQLVS